LASSVLQKSNVRIAGLNIIKGGETADAFLERTSGDGQRSGQKDGEGEHLVISSWKDELERLSAALQLVV
jgi:hypothetical protein